MKEKAFLNNEKVLEHFVYGMEDVETTGRWRKPDGKQKFWKEKVPSNFKIECYIFADKLCLKNCVRPRKYLYMQLSDFSETRRTPDNKDARETRYLPQVVFM